MAAKFLSPEEIDQLLNTVNSNGEIKDTGDNGQNARRNIDIGSGDKVYKYHEKVARKFTFDYISPVIKREDIIFAPAAERLPKQDKYVVYSLEQYRRRR